MVTRCVSQYLNLRSDRFSPINTGDIRSLLETLEVWLINTEDESLTVGRINRGGILGWRAHLGPVGPIIYYCPTCCIRVYSFVPTSRGDWRYFHDGTFLCVAALGAYSVMKMIAPALSSEGTLVGLLAGVVVIAGHRSGHVPTKLLVGIATLAVASALAFVLFVLLYIFYLSGVSV